MAAAAEKPPHCAPLVVPHKTVVQDPAALPQWLKSPAYTPHPIECGAITSINALAEITFVLFQNAGKCFWFPVIR